MTPAPSTITRMTPPCSLRLDLGVLDDFLVFRHLVANVGRELFTARPDRIEAERVQALLHVRQRQHFGDLRLQLVGKIGRQILRSPQSVPRYECEALHAGLLHGRNLGCRGRALEAGEAERLDLTALRQRQRGEHGIGEQLNLPAHEIGERRRSAFLGDHQGVEAGVVLEELDGEMAGGAEAGAAEGIFLRVLAHEREEIFQIVRRYARRGADDQRPLRQERHRSEVVHYVVGNALVEEWIDHLHRGRNYQGVTVGGGLGDGVGADYSGRAARAILDDEVLPYRLVELLHQDARDAVDRSAG